MSEPLPTKVSTPLWKCPNLAQSLKFLCGHHYFPALPQPTLAWSSPELHRLPLESSSTPPWWHHSWWMLETLHSSTFRLRMPHRYSIGFRSGDMHGQSITFTLKNIQGYKKILWKSLRTSNCLVFHIQHVCSAEERNSGLKLILSE